MAETLPPEITWTQAELDEFDRITMLLSSRLQMDRINARLDLKQFGETHGNEKLEAMFAVLKERDSKGKVR
ncbi:hypothetical protein [Mesorhizobium sp. B2-1-2]|uniref:hypothetical protein n=1 Tax=Mesorhizobium sp. B2-1-2 TaxID=2589973 RepID=UPI001128FF1F|nr:hypothetical protein [Mesorhizobium sp. B2-1-2]TPN04507.1 hypothetical protein FJ971_29620 [Mesorhizobium sp. B2-1-2]